RFPFPPVYLVREVVSTIQAIGNGILYEEILVANVEFDRATPVAHSTDEIVDTASAPLSNRHNKIFGRRERAITALCLILRRTNCETLVEVPNAAHEQFCTASGALQLQLSVADTIGNLYEFLR